MKLDRSLLFYAALLLVHLLFFLSSVIRPPGSLTDSVDYLNASRNIFSQGVLYCGDLTEPVREEQYTRRPPLYPVFLGISILSGSDIPLFLLQIMISLVSIFIVFRIFSPERPEQRNASGVIALILLLATPAQFIYSNRIMAEIPFQLLLVLSAWSVFKYSEKQENRFIWLFNLFLTLGMATKPVLYPFVILTVLISIYMLLRTRKRAFLLAVGLPVIWIIGYSVWNYNRTGSSQYSSIQTANLVNYNLRYFLMNQEGAKAATVEIDRLYTFCGTSASYREKNNCLDQGVREVILDRPVKYALFHLKGSIRLFLDPGRFDLVKFFSIQESNTSGFLTELNQDGFAGAVRFLKQQGWWLVILLGLIAIFKLLKITGFLLYMFRKGDHLYPRIFIVLLVGYLALVTGPLGASRFLLPVELLIIGGAVKGWAPLLKKL
ncbi:MAG: glycosyltransferase family 39 protein [Bacteroidales bacterium]|nr:glycosyltransferase family 39 protein [Bacteroidales bacterium]